MNKLNVSLQHSIATLAAKDWSARKIARELGVHRETVGRYLQLVEADSKPAIPPTGSQEDSDSKPAIVPAGSKPGRTSQCAPLSAVIEHGLLAGLSAQRIYQDLVTGHAFSVSVTHSTIGRRRHRGGRFML
jgi:IS30 family transposase